MNKKKRYLSSVVASFFASHYTMKRTTKWKAHIHTHKLTAATAAAIAAALWKWWLCVLDSFTQHWYAARVWECLCLRKMYYELGCVFVIVMMIDRRCWFPPFWFHNYYFYFYFIFFCSPIPDACILYEFVVLWNVIFFLFRRFMVDVVVVVVVFFFLAVFMVFYGFIFIFVY